MKLHKIILENIRSYTLQEFEFPLGSILLAGDVGSGKSTILLALEFGLFGLRPGLSGDSLLRNGAKKGSVLLHFEVEKKDIILQRVLKRSSASVSQEPGYIIVNGKREDVSPIELKERVLALLHYPAEFLTKSKGLVYRYTVYTPQEEMKHILFSEKEHRLEILRKVFGVDKYKRVRDNAKIYVSALKNTKKELAGKIFDLDEKKKIYSDKVSEKGSLEQKQINIQTNILDFKTQLEIQEQIIIKIQEELTSFRVLEKHLVMLQSTFNQKEKQLLKDSVEMERVGREIISLENSMKEEDIVDTGKISELDASLKLMYQQLSEKKSRKGMFQQQQHYAEGIKKNISTLDFCPLCNQKVTSEHIQAVILGEDQKILQAQEYLKTLEENTFELQNNIESTTRHLETLRKRSMAFEKYKIERKYLAEKKVLSEKLKQEYQQLQEELKNTQLEVKTVQDQLLTAKSIEERLLLTQQEMKRIEQEKRQQELMLHGLQIEIQSFEKQLLALQNEIHKKEKEKEELLHWNILQEWIEKEFLSSMEQAEQHILMRVYHDFNLYFQKWFGLLLEEENLAVRLDEEFTPLIEQNGHLIEYTYLSGGEKTAIALAYRLALNHVINQLLSVIQTRDLLILDEPTDGFSSAQVDRIRDVLKELNMSQIILVSHESKIESYVDTLIRIEKKGHISRVI